MNKSDLVGGLVWLLLGIGITIGSVRLNLTYAHNLGPGFLPFLSGLILGIFGLMLMFSSILKKPEGKQEQNIRKVWLHEHWKTFFYTLTALFGYAVLLETIGFVTVTFIFLFFLFKITQSKKWLAPALLSVSAVTISYLIFCLWLRCPFPTGILNF